jgi:hypothetical protein
MAYDTPTTSSRTLDTFKTKLTGGGARPNLFEVELYFPSDIGTSNTTLSEITRFLVKAASLPASNLGVIDVPFRGRNLKIAGDRTFDPWSITVINDTDFQIRTAFEQWMNYINKHEDNAGTLDPTDYQKDITVRQFGKSSVTSAGTPTTGSGKIPVLKSYKFYGVFPTSVSAIELSYDSSDTIEEFTVDLQVQWVDIMDTSGISQIGSSATVITPTPGTTP